MSRTPLAEHITPILQHLHRLAVKYQTNFNLTYKALNNLAPSFLSDYLHIYPPTRTLRSSLELALLLCGPEPLVMTHTALYLWNLLPQDVQNSESICVFKSRLKTNLFWQTFM